MNHFQHAIHIGQHLVVPETQHAIAFRFQELCSPGVTLNLQAGDAPATTLRLGLVDSNPLAPAQGQDLLAGKENFFLGNNPSKWLTDLSTYQQVAYSNVYPGVSAVCKRAASMTGPSTQMRI